MDMSHGCEIVRSRSVRVNDVLYYVECSSGSPSGVASCVWDHSTAAACTSTCSGMTGAHPRMHQLCRDVEGNEGNVES